MRAAVVTLVLAALLPGAAQAAPWVSMRHDARNTGRSTIKGVYRGDKPWAFKTGKGIFSTPVIGADGTVYVGSADSNFYAIRSTGKLRWKF